MDKTEENSFCSTAHKLHLNYTREMQSSLVAVKCIYVNKTKVIHIHLKSFAYAEFLRGCTVESPVSVKVSRFSIQQNSLGGDVSLSLYIYICFF